MKDLKRTRIMKQNSRPNLSMVQRPSNSTVYIGLTIVEFCEFRCVAASTRYRIIECHYLRSGEQIFAVSKSFGDTTLDDISNAIPDWKVALVFSL